MSFMPTSLDQLTQDLLNKDASKFVHTRSLDVNNTGLLTRKGIFPYEYIKDLSVLKESNLPPIEDFFSTLKNKGITEGEYLHAKEVWSAFNCENIGDYMRLYCRSDVHLLADLWSNFCQEISQNFNIHPESGYITLPSFAFDCFKNNIYTKKRQIVRLLDETKQKMLSDLGTGIRGGSCMLKQKASFSSAFEKTLLQLAEPDEKIEYEKLKILEEKAADEISSELTMNGGDEKNKMCSSGGCQRLTLNKFCTVHQETCILSFDFNNLYGEFFMLNSIFMC